MSTPYEKPTDELRAVQFRSPIEKGGVGYINNQLVAIQRKWIVQDGPIVVAKSAPTDGKKYIYSSDDKGDMVGMIFELVEGRLKWIPTKEEWRDLPAVTWEESRK